MSVSTVRVLAVIIFTFLFSEISAQQEWDVPWTVIGDSADLVPQTRVTVTGRIRLKDSKATISGASVSAETFKYFDTLTRLAVTYSICLQEGTGLL